MLGGPLLPRAVLPHSTPYGPLRLRSGLKAYPGLLSFALFRAKYRDGMHGIPYVVEISLRQRLGRWPRGKTTERNIPSAARRFAQDKLNVQPRHAPPRYRDFALLKISLRSTSLRQGPYDYAQGKQDKLTSNDELVRLWWTPTSRDFPRGIGTSLRSAVDGGLKFIFYFSCTFIELCGIVSVGEAYSFISQEYASNKRIMRDISLTACKQAKEMFE